MSVLKRGAVLPALALAGCAGVDCAPGKVNCTAEDRAGMSVAVAAAVIAQPSSLSDDGFEVTVERLSAPRRFGPVVAERELHHTGPGVWRTWSAEPATSVQGFACAPGRVVLREPGPQLTGCTLARPAVAGNVTVPPGFLLDCTAAMDACRVSLARDAAGPKAIRYRDIEPGEVVTLDMTSGFVGEPGVDPAP